MNAPRPFLDNRLVIASHNQGKLDEITALLKPYSIICESARALKLSEPDENGQTYLENALIKAQAARAATGRAVLSDDSGIEVDALDGEPGLHTAPFTSTQGGREAVFVKWAATPAIRANPRAHFVCVLVLLWPDGHYESFEGRVSGFLRFPPRGLGGHGYDPVFVPDGHTKTIAEMDMAEKNLCSHRFIALDKLVKGCFGSTR